MRLNTVFCSGLAAMSLTFGVGTESAFGLVTVTVHPGSQVAFVGSNVVFSAQVNATAGETVTGYAWLMSTNGQNPFSAVPGATTATCTLMGVQTSDNGFYFARVTYNAGTNVGLTSASAVVALTVLDQARITAQPQGGLNRLVGGSASFSVGALGLAPLSYQWRLNGTNLVNDGRITGADSTNLDIGALVLADSGNYDVVVTNLYAAATSQVARLDVFIPVGFSVPPLSTAVIVGSNAVLSVTASGSEPLSYQWQLGGMNLANGGRISGATSDVLTITATTTNDAGDYTVSIANPASALTSAVATLTGPGAGHLHERHEPRRAAGGIYKFHQHRHGHDSHHLRSGRFTSGTEPGADQWGHLGDPGGDGRFQCRALCHQCGDDDYRAVGDCADDGGSGHYEQLGRRRQARAAVQLPDYGQQSPRFIQLQRAASRAEL